MARKQGGVHFSYLIVAIVICLALIFVVVSQNSQLEDRKTALDRKDQELQRKDDQIKRQSTEIDDLRNLVVGSVDEAVPVADMSALIDRAGGEIATAMGKSSEVQYASFRDLYGDSVDTIRFLSGELASSKAAGEAKDSEFQEAATSKGNLSAQLNEEIDRLRSEVNDVQVQLERARSEARDEAARLREEIERDQQEHTSVAYQLERDLSLTENLLKRANNRIDVLKKEINQEQTFSMVEADGKVIRVSDELGFAWVDLGTEDRLRRGTVFDVFQYVKGGKRLSKGKIEVTKVEDDFAEVKILANIDKFNPISSGDLITSPFFNKKAQPVFVFAGEKFNNSRYSLEDVRRKIELFGGSVEGSVRLETSFVVALKGYDETGQYEAARELGITILREDELIDFIDF